MTLPNDTTSLLASTPPVAVVTANCLGWSLPDMVQLATLFYLALFNLALLIAHKICLGQLQTGAPMVRKAGNTP